MASPYKGRSKQTAPKSEVSGWACVSVCLRRLVSESALPLAAEAVPAFPELPGLWERPGTATSLGFTVSTELNQYFYGTQRTQDVILTKSIFSKWKGVITQSEESIRGNLKSLCKPVCSYFSNYAFLRGNFFSIQLYISKLFKISFKIIKIQYSFQIKQSKK